MPFCKTSCAGTSFKKFILHSNLTKGKREVNIFFYKPYARAVILEKCLQHPAIIRDYEFQIINRCLSDKEMGRLLEGHSIYKKTISNF
ncbi:hypothetical protein RHT_00171 [Candidatus Rhabdochlamydia sp. T3358]|nr:hypothetical protein RHT_00171 [Candidatus Rhabdochlamydia sp. T3358]